MTSATTLEVTNLWCEAIRYVLRTRRIYVAEREIQAALAQGHVPSEIVRRFEARQSAVSAILTRALRIWDGWVRR